MKQLTFLRPKNDLENAVELERPTLSQLVAHAQKFGTEQVAETATRYLFGSELLQLETELKRIDGERRQKFGELPKRKRMPKAKRLQMVKFLSEEGLPNTRIANQLGVSVRQVERLLQQAKSAEDTESA